jgi:DNA-directed RNA polymerase beta subunit
VEIRVCNDGGRLTCPVLRVKNNDVIITNGIIDRLTNSTLEWNDLLTNCYIPESVIEYIDPDEQNLSMIAMKSKIDNLSNFNYRYTHCEIPSTSVFWRRVFRLESNQSPRNVYQTAMMKQALGIYSLNYDQRMDKTAYAASVSPYG